MGQHKSVQVELNVVMNDILFRNDPVETVT